MKAATYIEHGKIALLDKPEPEILRIPEPTTETKPEIGSVMITNQPRDYYLHHFAISASISSIVLGMEAERFSHPVSVTRQLSSRRKPIPHSSW